MYIFPADVGLDLIHYFVTWFLHVFEYEHYSQWRRQDLVRGGARN